MAMLLGASVSEAGPLILQASAFKRSFTSCDASNPCEDHSACHPNAKICLNPPASAALLLSEPELTIEDALTRALMRQFFAKGAAVGLSRQEIFFPLDPTESGDPLRKVLFHWGGRYRCGKDVCSFSRVSEKGEDRLVRFDLRDRGTASESVATEDRADVKRCRKETGAGTWRECVDTCTAHGQGLSCSNRCAKYCTQSQ